MGFRISTRRRAAREGRGLHRSVRGFERSRRDLVIESQRKSTRYRHAARVFVRGHLRGAARRQRNPDRARKRSLGCLSRSTKGRSAVVGGGSQNQPEAQTAQNGRGAPRAAASSITSQSPLPCRPPPWWPPRRSPPPCHLAPRWPPSWSRACAASGVHHCRTKSATCRPEVRQGAGVRTNKGSGAR